MKILILLTIMLTITGCSMNGNTFSERVEGSYVQLGHTLGAISEFKNTEKIQEENAKVHLRYGMFHAEYENQNLISDGAPEGALHNREFRWVGVGAHTTGGTEFTYYRDTNDSVNNYWKMSLINTHKVRRKISTLVGVNHYDREGGTLLTSGGSRTTNLYGGVLVNVSKGFSILADMSVGNNGAAFIQDVIKLNLRWTY